MKEYEEFDGNSAEEQEIAIDLMPYLKKALKGWKKILLFALVGAVFGLIAAFSIPRTYTTKAVVAPELITRSSAGGLSSLASLAGINMNNMALTDAMHPDMYPEIIHSTNFYLNLFDMPVTVQTKDSLVHTDLYDYMVNYYKRPWYGAILGLPQAMIGGIKKLFTHEEEEETGHEHVDSLRLTRQQEMVVRALAKRITANVEKRSYVITLQVTMQDPVIAAQLANAVIDNLRRFVVSYRTEKSRENVDYYQKLYDENREAYLKAQRALAYYMDSHQNISGRSTMVQQQQLQNEVQLRYQMYSQTAQNLMNAQAKVQQEAPVLVVIQPGIAPQRGKPSKTKLVLLWLVIGALAGVVFVCSKKG